MTRPVIVFAANRGYALLSSRKGLVERFCDSGWTVVLATEDDAESRALVASGAVLRRVRFNRGGATPLVDWSAYRALVAICREWKPLIIQNFHAKPVILGSLAARRTLGQQVRVVNTITGLGHAFIQGGIAARLAGMGYSVAMPRADVVVFQNKDDQKLFFDQGWARTDQSRLIVSSGVDVDRFRMVDRSNRSDQAPVVVMLGRLLNQKGIPEFVEVAGRIKARLPECRFLLAGEKDPNHPDAVDQEWLDKQSAIEYVGRLSDVVPLLAQADLLLFPSYREGAPRVILEAAASGLPTVGFAVPGVSEAVRDGETGYLVDYPDVEAMTARVWELISNSGKRLAMGAAARAMVDKEFDIRQIERKYLDVYRELGAAI